MPDNISLIVRAALLIDGLGGPPVAPALVAVAGERVAYAGPPGSAPPLPPDVPVIDRPGACLLPGLIDMHVHPTYYWEEPDSASYTYESEDALVYSDLTVAFLAAANLRQALQAGVTTARDTGSVNQVMFEVRRAIRKGWIPGPDVYVSGRLIVPTGGHVHYLPGLAHQADGVDGLRRAVREEIRTGADFIKLANNRADLTQDELNAAVDEAHRLGVKVACHTSRPPSQRMAIDARVDTFEHGTPTDEEIDLAAARGIAWTPTLTVTQNYLERARRNKEAVAPGSPAATWEAEYRDTVEYIDRKHLSIAHALRAGLRLVAGTDSWMREQPFGAIADEICWLAAYGCTPMQAIQSATLWPAEAMAWPNIGRLTPGSQADLIAVPGDPLSDLGVLRRPSLVVLHGRPIQNTA